MRPFLIRTQERRVASLAWASTLALVLLGVILGVRSEQGYRRQTEREVAVQAEVLAASVTAALSFDDETALRQYVGSLAINRRIAAAAVYDASGRQRMAIGHPPASQAPARFRTGWQGGRVTVTRPVAEQGQLLGSVYVETTPETWRGLLARHGAFALLVSAAFLLLIVATWAATRLERRAAQLRDANARLQEEMTARAKAEEALVQSQKMEALGQLTGGIAHDFNNLLQAIGGAFGLIRRKPGDPRVTAWAENGAEAVERGANLTRQLLAFSRSQRLELKPLIVDQLIEDMRELLARTLGPTIELVLRLEAGAAPVLTDRTQLEMAVLNLAINARDAMPAGGRLTLATQVVPIPAGHPFLMADDYVELGVTDTGSGMPAQVVERAFDPFFTTKGIGKGTGLGLSQVYGMARQAGGEARIQSAPGQGTKVTILLRRSNAEVEALMGGAGAGGPLPMQPGRTILVVDDDAQVRALLSDTLETIGYRVLQADGGQAAMQVLRETRPDLMLLDFAMPRMNGAQTARQARRRFPDLPIIVASGHADSEALAQALGDEAVILRKPFDMEALARGIAGVLSQAPPSRSAPTAATGPGPSPPA
jgi:signal transduction histidine kinase/CheY-like chemotaxis protein